jgi:hypothetical protein
MMMLYMVIEEFKEGAIPVYRRFRDNGRMTPHGLSYLNSWVTSDMRRCYQLMETDDPALLKRWTDLWEDIIEFQVVPVVTSTEAAAALGPKL